MALPSISTTGTSTQIMNMSKSRSSSSSASTFSTFFNPIKKTFGIKKRLSKRGTNALYRAISSEKWDLVCTICDTKPYKAEAWHNAVGFFDAHRSSRILPLHQACIFQPSKEAVVHIIQAYPNALQSKESGYGRVPLHIACHSNASIECIQVLVMHNPAASIEQDIIGRVPLHYALSNGASYDVVQILMNAAEQVNGQEGVRRVCSIQDFNGWLPIHVACFMGASAQVLSMIVDAYPEGIEIATKKNSTPKGLLKGITMAPEKKKVLESILNEGGSGNRGGNRIGQHPYASRVSPARTNMEKVVRMSDETCSKGVTLEIDEDETSSLSSMETTKTGGLMKKSRSKKRLTATGMYGHGQHGQHMQGHGIDEYRTTTLESAKPIPYNNTSQRVVSSSSRVSNSSQLPTHSIYDQEESIMKSNGMITNNANKINRNVNINGNINHNVNGNLGYTNTAKLDVYYPPEKAKSRMSKIRNSARSLTSRESSKSITTQSDDEDSSDAIFQPIDSTAAFC
jgi:hypothetical protein